MSWGVEIAMGFGIIKRILPDIVRIDPKLKREAQFVFIKKL